MSGSKLPLKVISFAAGPGAGKSTAAAGLFNMMKTLGHRVELVTEFAKDLTYERQMAKLDHQLGVLAEQDWRLRRLVGQGPEWVITDSPLYLGEAYMGPEYGEWLSPALWAAFHRYENYMVLLKRTDEHGFQSYGRNQTEDEAKAIDHRVEGLFSRAITGYPQHRWMVAQSNHTTAYKVYEEFITHGAP